MSRPLSELDPNVATRVEVIGLDVDGVLTDGGVYVGQLGSNAVELKRFDIQDNIAVKLLRGAGVRVVIVSGRISQATTIRAEELGVDELVQDDLARKLPAFEEILARLGVSFEASAFVGDDLPDLPLLLRVGLSVTVPNAVRDVKEAAHYITQRAGGHGAIREFAEEFLRARDQWGEVVERYLSERGETFTRMSGVRTT